MDLNKLITKARTYLQNAKKGAAPVKTPAQKRKQTYIGVWVILVSVAVVYLTMAAMNTKTFVAKPRDDGSTHINMNTDPSMTWEERGESKLVSVQDQIGKLQGKVDQILKSSHDQSLAYQQQINDLHKQLSQSSQTVKNLQSTLTQVANQRGERQGSSARNSHTGSHSAGQGGNVTAGNFNTGNATYAGQVGESFGTDRIHVWHYPQKTPKKTETHKQVRNQDAGYLPADTQFTAYLLHGAMAYTGSVAATSNLVPVNILVTSNGITPNGHRYWLKGCRVLCKAYGDLSSMRVTVRLANLECLDPNTGHWFISKGKEIKGYVVDSDGLAGLRGKYISYQGPRLWIATLSKAIEGAGNYFSQSQGTTTLSSLTGGTTKTVDGAGIIKSMGGGALSGGASELSKFYVDQLKMLSPVLKVNAGRVVTINLSQGVVLNWVDRHNHYINTPPAATRMVDGNGKVVKVHSQSIDNTTSDNGSNNTISTNSERVANTFDGNSEQIAKATAQSNYATNFSGMYMSKRNLKESEHRAGGAFGQNGASNGK